MSTIETATLPDGRTLQYERLGDRSSPVVMPILGITDNLTDWPKSFCEIFLEAGYGVVRHELRDMGRSDPCDGVPYTMADIAQDVVALMDYLDIEQADLIGYSFGGAVAQLTALNFPVRVRRLVLLQSSDYNPELPARSAQVDAAMRAACQTYSDPRDAIDAIRMLRRACGGSKHVMSHDEALKSAQQSVARAYCPEGSRRLIAARKRTPPFHQRLSEIRCPTLVLQATDDPIFPLGHGEDIARRIPHASLAYLHGAGHGHPESLRLPMLEKIVEFLARPIR